MAASDVIVPPSTRDAWREVWTLRELPRILAHAPWLLRVPRGDGTPVLTLPGAGAGDRSTLLLRAYLNRIGYRAFPWRLGVNDANVEALLPTVTHLVRRLAEEHQQPVVLTGWSNGGIIAREVARDAPELVRHIFTYGTPIIGGPRYTIGARFYALEEIARLEALIEEREQVPLAVPVTAFWSRRDGIVSWRSCIDRRNPTVESIEVRSSHLGMTVDPAIWRTIALRLATSPRQGPRPVA